MEGIDNLGATCAINSLIQLICRCEKIRNIILNTEIDNNTFTGELKEIIDLMYNKNKSLHPIKFINSFYKIFEGIFKRYEQIDINELWLYVYQKINEETEISKKKIEEIKNINDEHDYNIDIYNNNKESNIMKIIQGSFINIIQCCKCNNKTYKFEPFINILLDIDIDDKDNNTIADLIINYMKNEFREKDEWKCDKCNENTSYIKTNRIWKLPKVLFISLNRFKDVYNKNNKEVYINDNIVFNKGSILNNDIDVKYNLQGLALHSGDLLGGHYTAICNMKNGYYNFYNDNQINIIKKEDLVSKMITNSVYLLVYEIDEN